MEVPPTAFIIGCAAACWALASELVRKVGISCLALGTVVTRPRTLLWISSGLKSFAGSIHVPASMPATFNPARASGKTATPPAAPSPTTATSTGGRLVAMVWSRAFSGGPVGRVVIGFDFHAHLLIVGRSGKALSRVPEQIPAREILVAAVEGIAEHPFHGETPRAIEERASIRKSRRRAALHGGEQRVLLVVRQIDKCPIVGAVRECVGSLQAFDERSFLPGQIIA